MVQFDYFCFCAAFIKTNLLAIFKKVIIIVINTIPDARLAKTSLGQWIPK
jgi:hypothetical protein